MKSEEENIIVLQNVSKIYNGSVTVTSGVKGINLTVRQGELVLLLGPSGSGKTTLLTLIAGLIKPTYGTLSLFSKKINSYSRQELQQLRAKRIGFIFQTFLLLESLTANENIRLVLKFLGKNGKTAEKTASGLLEKFGVNHLSGRFPSSMSQGEKQRVATARALANNPDLVLADEPTASLEVNQGLEIINSLHSYSNKENKCVIVASHDLRLKDYADRIIYLEDGKMK